MKPTIVTTVGLAALGLHLSAHAQSVHGQLPSSGGQGGASVDAAATLRIVTPPIALDAGDTLDFGTVSVPNGSAPGNRCEYRLRPLSSGPRYDAFEVSADGTIVANSFPTPSACDQGEDGQLGTYALQCDAGRPVSYTVAYADAAVAGLSFGRVPNAQTLFAPSEPGMTTLSTTALQTTKACPDDGGLVLSVGGRLLVEETASVGQATVGSVTLSAEY